jgi:hypothetical protein
MARRLTTIGVLCAPSIIGTGYFLVGLVAARFRDDSGFDPFREPRPLEWLLMNALFLIMGACWFGATLGPLLIPVAAHQAVGMTRELGLHSRLALSAWSIVVLGLAATALFWCWLIHLEIVP